MAIVAVQYVTVGAQLADATFQHDTPPVKHKPSGQ